MVAGDHHRRHCPPCGIRPPPGAPRVAMGRSGPRGRARVMPDSTSRRRTPWRSPLTSRWPPPVPACLGPPKLHRHLCGRGPRFTDPTHSGSTVSGAPLVSVNQPRASACSVLIRLRVGSKGHSCSRGCARARRTGSMPACCARCAKAVSVGSPRHRPRASSVASLHSRQARQSSPPAAGPMSRALRSLHRVDRQGSGLVRTDEGDRAQRLDGRQPPHQRVDLHHPACAQRQQDGHDGRQRFGNGRDREADRRHGHQEDRLAAQQAHPNTIAQIASATSDRRLPNTASRFCSGVLPCSV